MRKTPASRDKTNKSGAVMGALSAGGKNKRKMRWMHPFVALTVKSMA